MEWSWSEYGKLEGVDSTHRLGSFWFRWRCQDFNNCFHFGTRWIRNIHFSLPYPGWVPPFVLQICPSLSMHKSQSGCKHSYQKPIQVESISTKGFYFQTAKYLSMPKPCMLLLKQVVILKYNWKKHLIIFGNSCYICTHFPEPGHVQLSPRSQLTKKPVVPAWRKMKLPSPACIFWYLGPNTALKYQAR